MKKADVIRHFGGTQNATAEALGVTQAAVSAWPDLVPERIAWKVQVITAGRLTVNPEDYARAKRRRFGHRRVRHAPPTPET